MVIPSPIRLFPRSRIFCSGSAGSGSCLFPPSWDIAPCYLSVFRFKLPEIFSLPSFGISFDLSKWRLQFVLCLGIWTWFSATSTRPPLSLCLQLPFVILRRRSCFGLLGHGQTSWEFQVISCCVSFTSSDTCLSYDPEFISKTESASHPLLALSYLSPSQISLLAWIRISLLCPVRALWVYLRRTSSVANHPRHLFVSPHSTSRSIFKNGISYFLR